MSRFKTIAAVASVVVALGLPLLGGIKAHIDRQASSVVRFTVEPYDPRDILYGHYMRFKIVWNWEKGQPAPIPLDNDKTCLCVGEGNLNPVVRWTSCPPRGIMTVAGCSHVLTGKYSAFPVPDGEPVVHDFNIGIDRYYVDETVGPGLDTLFAAKTKDFTVGLALKPYGKPILEKLYIGGQSLSDYLAAHGGKFDDNVPER